MIKRLIIVLIVAAGIVFVPYWVGGLCLPRQIVFLKWWFGVIVIVPIAPLYIFVIEPTIHYIKHGK